MTVTLRDEEHIIQRMSTYQARMIVNKRVHEASRGLLQSSCGPRQNTALHHSDDQQRNSSNALHRSSGTCHQSTSLLQVQQLTGNNKNKNVIVSLKYAAKVTRSAECSCHEEC